MSLEAYLLSQPNLREYLDSQDSRKIYAAIMNCTGGLSNSGLPADEAEQIIRELQAAHPDEFEIFQRRLRVDSGELGYEAGAYDGFILSL